MAQGLDQSVSSVAVGVYEAGHDHLAGGVNDLAGGVVGLHLGAGPDGHYAVVFNGDGAVWDDAALRVHGDDGAAGDEDGCVGHRGLLVEGFMEGL